jgi:outer membrane protein assembly factor BamE (lipoprotein component of BamABCDE complex)
MRPRFRWWLYWSGAGVLVLLLLGDLLMVSKPPSTEREQGTELIEPQQIGEVREPQQESYALESQQTGQATGPGHVTEANFALVRNGMSRDEVDSLLGREHRFIGGSSTCMARVKITSNREERIYEEGKGRLRKRAFIAFEMRNYTVTNKEFVDEPANPGHVTEENFARIRNDMTQKEVDHLLGREHWAGAFGTLRWSVLHYEEGYGRVRKRATVNFRGDTAEEKEFEVITLTQAEWLRILINELRWRVRLYLVPFS